MAGSGTLSRDFAIGAAWLAAALVFAQTTAARPKETVVQGVVVDPHGKPLADAEVFYVPWDEPDSSCDFSRPIRTDAQGRFQVRVAAKIHLADLTPGRCLLRALVGSARAKRIQYFFARKVTLPQYMVDPIGGKPRLVNPNAPLPDIVERVDREAMLNVDLGDLWVICPGHRVGFFKLKSPDGKAPGTVRVVLEAPGDFEVTIVGPDGTPVSGARVVLRRVSVTEKMEGALRWVVSPPEELLPRWAATTNDRGVAAVTALAWEEVEGLDVIHPDFGRQSVELTFGDPPRIALARAGRVRGRLVADRPEVVGGVRLRIRSRVVRFEQGPTMRGEEEVTTDAEGRFESPLVPNGGLSIELADPAKGSHFDPDKPEYLLQPTGDMRFDSPSLETTLRLRQSVRVHGTVRSKTTGEPIPNVEILLKTDYGNQLVMRGVTADASGRFEFYEIPCRAEYSVDEGEDGTDFCDALRRVVIPAGKKELELPPVQLVAVHGRVVDDDDKPVGGVQILFVCQRPTRRPARQPTLLESLLLTQEFEYNSTHTELTTDARGGFEVWVDPQSEWAAQPAPQDRNAIRETEWATFKPLPDGTLPELVLHLAANRAEAPVAEAAGDSPSERH